MGQGVTQDDPQALRWMTKAAEQGHASAQYEVGSYYVLPPDQDYGKAAYWLRKAAEQGYARAQFSLSTLYYAGYGVEQDRLEAYAWMALAVFNGDPEAFDKLMDIKAGFTQGEFEQAHERAQRYQEKYSPK
jgi:TPR repeat protein